MSWSYSTDLTADKDKVRFLAGDTLEDDHLIEDQEITFALTEEGSVDAAAALVLEHLAARYARKADKTVGPLSISYSQIAESYQKRADELRSVQSAGGRSTIYCSPSAGGISVSQKQTEEQDEDRVKPSFHREMFKSPDSSDPRFETRNRP